MAGFWMHETSGVLRPVIEAYLTTDAELSPGQVATVRAYLRQWIEDPAWVPSAGLDLLRATVGSLASRKNIDAWLDRAMEAGIDPL